MLINMNISIEMMASQAWVYRLLSLETLRILNAICD